MESKEKTVNKHGKQRKKLTISIYTNPTERKQKKYLSLTEAGGGAAAARPTGRSRCRATTDRACK